MSIPKWLGAVVCASALAGLGHGEPPADLEKSAEALLAALAQEDFPTASRNFDAAMQKALPADKLAATWKSLLGQVGRLQKTTGVRREKVDRFDVVVVTAQFEKTALDVRVTFTADGQVTGLFFAPAKPPPYQPPSYVKRDAFEEKEVQVGTGAWALPGTLSKPAGDGPFPAVVLVHGSGPHDRDETIGPNRPFRDLAWGLASRGVAVLRYEKRTKEHGAKLAQLKSITIEQETTADAILAVQLLTQTPGIDPKRVYVLGHSLGATLAPRIAQREATVAGIILLAGATRPLEDLVVEQTAYLLSLEGPLTDAGKAHLEKLKAQVARVKDPKLSTETPPEELPLGVPAGYWLALRTVKPAETASRLQVPIIVLQGERDYQVTMVDFAGWKQALGNRPDVAFKSYPALNHLFMSGTGKSTPAEYSQAGHVAVAVIDDIAGWVKKR